MFWAAMMRSSWLRGSTLAICIVGLFWVQAEGTRAEGPGSIEFGQFSSALASETLPKGWEPLTFKKIPRHTLYSLVKDKEGTVVKAVSEASSSGMAKEMSVNPREYPFIEWKWNAKNLLKKGDVSRKDGDDSPARLYVTFAFDPSRVNVFKRFLYEAIKLIYGRYPPLGAVNYIWDSRAPVGTMLPNAYTDQVMMFVLENSPARLNMWITEQRNVYEDYKRAFGQEPPMISGVAIMTDTDNTGESAEALYGDIIFLKAAR
jgi:hypothetical protein